MVPNLCSMQRQSNKPPNTKEQAARYTRGLCLPQNQLRPKSDTSSLSSGHADRTPHGSIDPRQARTLRVRSILSTVLHHRVWQNRDHFSKQQRGVFGSTSEGGSQRHGKNGSATFSCIQLSKPRSSGESTSCNFLGNCVYSKNTFDKTTPML